MCEARVPQKTNLQLTEEHPGTVSVSTLKSTSPLSIDEFKSVTRFCSCVVIYLLIVCTGLQIVVLLGVQRPL